MAANLLCPDCKWDPTYIINKLIEEGGGGSTEDLTFHALTETQFSNESGIDVEDKKNFFVTLASDHVEDDYVTFELLDNAVVGKEYCFVVSNPSAVDVAVSPNASSRQRWWITENKTVTAKGMSVFKVVYTGTELDIKLFMDGQLLENFDL